MTTELTFEQKMAYVRKALELGANIQVRFHNYLDKDEATKTAFELSDFLQIPVSRRDYNGTHWFSIGEDYSIETTVYFNEKTQEEAV